MEIELTGITRQTAAETVADYFNTTYSHVGGAYDPYAVHDSSNRTWKFVYDGSIDCKDRNGNPQGRDYSVEFVTPICTYDDIPVIQQIVRELRHKGAIADESCGIHIHVNGAPYDARSLRNITNIMRSKEDLIYKAYDEFMLQCNFACQELTIGVYGGINSFAQARDLCLKISDKLCDDWEEIITSLEHYMNVLKSGKKINMAYAEQKDLLDSFYELTKSIPTYENDLYH